MENTKSNKEEAQ